MAFETVANWIVIAGSVALFLVIVLFVYLGYVLWIPWPLRLSPTLSVILDAIGLAAYLAGLLLALWARWALSAMYGVSTSSATQLHVKHRLIQHGTYALVRHPMYLGYWLVLAGATLVYHTWTPLVLLIGLSQKAGPRRQKGAGPKQEGAVRVSFGQVSWHGLQLATTGVACSNRLIRLRTLPKQHEPWGFRKSHAHCPALMPALMSSTQALRSWGGARRISPTVCRKQ